MTTDKGMQDALSQVSVQMAEEYTRWCKLVANRLPSNITWVGVSQDPDFLKAWDNYMTPEQAISYVTGQ